MNVVLDIDIFPDSEKKAISDFGKSCLAISKCRRPMLPVPTIRILDTSVCHVTIDHRVSKTIAITVLVREPYQEKSCQVANFWPSLIKLALACFNPSPTKLSRFAVATPETLSSESPTEM